MAPPRAGRQAPTDVFIGSPLQRRVAMTRAGFKEAFGRIGKSETFKDGISRAGARVKNFFSTTEPGHLAAVGTTYK
ncbi:MAG: hypothetical protein ACAI34_23680, partial [Verrucomicrobium sp.]